MSSVKRVEQLDRVIIRFAGDSGDGMQLTGDRFTSETAALGNDLGDVPRLSRRDPRPAGSLPGVSGFQVHFADHDILTAGDRPDVLVAMNPAALRANIADLPKGATIIVNTDAFNDRTLQKAGYAANPLEDGSLADYHLHEVALTSMTWGAQGDRRDHPARRSARRTSSRSGSCRGSTTAPSRGRSRSSSRSSRSGPRSSTRTRRRSAGWNYGETSGVSYEVASAPWRRHLPTDHGEHRPCERPRRRVEALGLQLFLGAYPITPASSILEGSPRARSSASSRSRPRTRSPPSALRSARRSAVLGVTASAGPGVVLKAETVGLAIALELPLIILDIQGGPVDRDADEARAGRPADGALRPERRARAPVVAASSPSSASTPRSRRPHRSSTGPRVPAWTRTSRTARSRG